MKKLFTLLSFILLTGHLAFSQGVRYIDEVFDSVTTLTNQIYTVNITVVTGAPAPDTLRFDLYMPDGDTCTSRPLAVLLHTGTFLPRGFVSPTGDKNDYANVQVAERLAKRGYVAASVQYRKGWNPVAPTDIVRRNTIINAAYRGIQDLYTFIRFMNKTVVDLGNPYSIDTSRVAVFGIGTGAFVGFNAAVLSQDEIYIDKFRDPVTGTPFIDTNLVGDLHGTQLKLINFPAHIGYNDNFHFAFGLDGAVGDSSWLEDGNSVPLVAAGTVTHPTTPYGFDPITGEVNCDLPVFAGAGTGSFVVNIGGSVCMITKANELGINDPLNKTEYNDPVSEEIRSNPNTNGQEHLWGINLPGPQTGPWEFWDSTFWDTRPHPLLNPISINDVAMATNPDMSQEKADHYIDTALWFFSPRAYTVLNLGGLVCSCENVVPDAQLITDFECRRNYPFTTGADKLCIINNNLPNAENDSEKVGQYMDPPNDAFAALCVDFGDPIDLSTYNLFTVQMYSEKSLPVLYKLEGGSSPPFEVWKDFTASDTWQTIQVDFSSQAEANHEKLCIFPNAGVEQPELDNYYFDNLRWELETGIFTPVVETLEISPNPVNDVLHIKHTGKATSFRVINILGQTVIETPTNGLSNLTISMASVQDGIYVIAGYDQAGNLIANARVLKN